MLELKEKIISTLQAICPDYPVLLNGSMTPDAVYPADFVTYWILESPTVASFDNASALTAWEFQVSFFSNNPLHVAEESKRIRQGLKDAGFIPEGRGFDTPVEEAGFTAWIIRCKYLERY